MEENNTAASGMQLLAQKAKLTLSGERELLSAGMVGVVGVCFSCSEDWDGLSKIAVFSNGAVSVDVPESAWDDGVCTVPREVLECAGKTVLAGLYGTDGEHVILPTVWCSLGRVEAGAVPACQNAKPADVPLWAQLLGRIEALEAQPASGYQPPAGGIPESDLSAATKTALGRSVIELETYLGSATRFTMSMSMSDIYAAYQAGGDVYIRYEDPYTAEKVDCRLVRLDGFDSAIFVGCKVNVNTDEVTAIVFTAMNDLVEKNEIALGGGASSASSVTITDTAGYYTSGNVEGALAELGGMLSDPDEAGEVSVDNAITPQSTGVPTSAAVIAYINGLGTVEGGSY